MNWRLGDQRRDSIYFHGIQVEHFGIELFVDAGIGEENLRRTGSTISSRISDLRISAID